MIMRKRIPLLLTALLFLLSCGDDEVFEKQKDSPQVYELVSIEFTPSTEGFDTIPGKPEILCWENHGTVPQVVIDSLLLERSTHSKFDVPNERLPKGSNINDLLANIPDIDGEPKIIGLTASNYPFAFGEEQVLKESIGYDKFTVTLSPHKKTTLAHRYIGYALEADYHAIVRNLLSGEQIKLTGKWRGLQQVNTETVLSEEDL